MIYIYPKKLISKINMSIRIIISDAKGKMKEIRVNEDDLIKTCKEKSGCSPDKTEWIVDGYVLENDKTIKDYDLKGDVRIIYIEEFKAG